MDMYTYRNIVAGLVLLVLAGCGGSKETMDIGGELTLSESRTINPLESPVSNLSIRVKVVRGDSTPVRNVLVQTLPPTSGVKTNFNGMATLNAGLIEDEVYLLRARIPGSDSLASLDNVTAGIPDTLILSIQYVPYVQRKRSSELDFEDVEDSYTRIIEEFYGPPRGACGQVYGPPRKCN